MNFIDIVSVIFILGAVLSACHRGLGREVLHTTLYLVVGGGCVLFLNNTPIPQTQPEVSKMALSILFFLMAMYAFTWGAVKFIAPLIMPSEVRNVRSQFWAGALSALKIVIMILSVNMWYAQHSVEGGQARLTYLPQMMQQSVFVHIADRATDDVYRVLAQQNILNPEEYNKKIASHGTRDDAVLDRLSDSSSSASVPDYEPAAGNTVAEPLPEQRPESYE